MDEPPTAIAAGLSNEPPSAGGNAPPGAIAGGGVGGCGVAADATDGGRRVAGYCGSCSSEAP
jgi:hypothetical protein